MRDPLKSNRCDRDRDETQDGEIESLFHRRDRSEKCTRTHADSNPEDAADDVEKHEPTEGHGAHACHERSERPNHGYESGDDNGFATIPLEELVGFLEVGLGEDFGLGVVESPFADRLPNEVIHHVAQDRRRGEQDEHHQETDVVLGLFGGDIANGEEEGVTREERKDNEARFRKDDGREDPVDLRPVLPCGVFEMLINMQNVVEQCESSRVISNPIQGTRTV